MDATECDCLRTLATNVDITTALYKQLVDTNGVDTELKHALITNMDETPEMGRSTIIDHVIEAFNAIRNGNYSDVRGYLTVMIGSGRVSIRVLYRVMILEVPFTFEQTTIDSLNRLSSFADLKRCLTMNRTTQSIELFRDDFKDSLGFNSIDLIGDNHIDDGDCIASPHTRQQFYNIKFKILPPTMTKWARK